MKKNILIIIVAFLIVLVTTFSIFKNNTKETDASKFKKEYESLNNTYNEKSKHDYVKIEIDNDKKIIITSFYLNYNEDTKLVKNYSIKGYLLEK